MVALLDRLLVFSCCFILLLVQGTGIWGVVAFLVAISISSLGALWGSRPFLLWSVFTYTGAVLFQSSFVFFLPLVFYEAWVFYHGEKSLAWPVAAFISLLFAFIVLPLGTACLLVLLMAVGYVLSGRTREISFQRQKTLRLRDDSWELAMRLKEKNKELLEKKDYELHLAMLEERGRIAREIHDHVGHLLSRSILQIGALGVKEQDKERQQSLASIRDTLSEAMERIRQSVYGLYEESLDLRTQIDILVSDFTFCPLRLDYKLGRNPAREVENCFLAIIKEGLHNVVRHSNATNVTLTIVEHPALYRLILQDNGSRASKENKGGLGLRSMADRVESLNGRFVVTRDGGFGLSVSIPKGGAQGESVVG